MQQAFPITAKHNVLRAEAGSKSPNAHPLKIAVLFSGGEAPGGHNVLVGLLDALQEIHPQSRLFGFLNGSEGLLSGQSKHLLREEITLVRNQGGFELIGSGRKKIETKAEFVQALRGVQELDLDGLVIVGGDDSNTNAAMLAEYFSKEKCKTCVIGVPKTIDGDVKNPYVATPFGFDTACKVYSELIGNLAKDALTTRKYTHFIRLMGRSASHIALECALSTQPNCTLIGEEVAAANKTLKQIGEEVTQLVMKRGEAGKNYGVILIPEGLVEFIPEMKLLIEELNRLVAEQSTISVTEVLPQLSKKSASCYSALPKTIQEELLLNRDSHGNVHVSSIETELLLIELVRMNVASRQKKFQGNFTPMHHFFGYEGRGSYPSNFDCNYCTALGKAAAHMIDQRLSGYLCAIHDLAQAPTEWQLFAIPLPRLMHRELRKGKMTSVVRKTLVDLSGSAFQNFQAKRANWSIEDHYLFPGPMQFYGDPCLTDCGPRSISLSR